MHFTTVYMPLVRTPMIAPTNIYDAFPTLSPDEAAKMICDAIIDKPKRVASRLGTFGQVLYAVSPKTVDRIMNSAYKIFPDSKAAKGETRRKRTATTTEEGRQEGRGDVHRGHRHGVPDEGRALLVSSGQCAGRRAQGAGPKPSLLPTAHCPLRTTRLDAGSPSRASRDRSRTPASLSAPARAPSSRCPTS